MAWLGRASLYAAALVIVAMLVAVVYGAFARYFLPRSPNWPGPISEYALLLSTVLAAPYLMRQNSHIVVDALLRAVGPAVRKYLAGGAYLVTAITCLIMAYYATLVSYDAILRNYQDVRSISVPLYVLTIPVAYGFAHMAAESIRSLFIMAPSRAAGAGV